VRARRWLALCGLALLLPAAIGLALYLLLSLRLGDPRLNWPAGPFALAAGVVAGLACLGFVVVAWRQARQLAAEHAAAAQQAAEFRAAAAERLAAERATLEARLQADREEQAGIRARFMQLLNHEFKNPLQALRAGLADLEPRLGPGESLAAARAHVERLSRLVLRLRDLSALETEPLQPSSVDMSELLTEVKDLYEGETGRRVALTIRSGPWPVGKIQGDHELLLIAFRNLVDNAIKYSLPPSPVEIYAYSDRANVVVAVIDNGCGIPESEFDRIFEWLYRGRNVSAVEGTGLGLAAVKAIVERHGGHVDVESVEGRGTVVTVQIPSQPLPA